MELFKSTVLIKNFEGLSKDFQIVFEHPSFFIVFLYNLGHAACPLVLPVPYLVYVTKVLLGLQLLNEQAASQLRKEVRAVILDQ